MEQKPTGQELHLLFINGVSSAVTKVEWKVEPLIGLDKKVYVVALEKIDSLVA